MNRQEHPLAQVMAQESDPVALKRAALTLAKSDGERDHELLLQHLRTQAFLSRLDPGDLDAMTRSDLRVRRVLDLLSANRASVAHGTLIELIGAREFQSHVYRMQLLIAALARIPSPPQAVIDYWDRTSQVGSPIAYDVVRALVENQSQPALALLEKKLQSGHHPDQVTAWLRQLVLPHRNDKPLLECCESVGKRGLQPPLDQRLLEALFHYDPDDWYRGCNPPVPPLRSLASRPSKDILLRIARVALERADLDPALRAAISLAEREVR